MSTSKRPHATSVIERLVDEPYRFEFFQSVRLLERYFTSVSPEKSIEIGGEQIFFNSSLSLNFPASEVQALHATDTEGLPVEAPQLTKTNQKMASVAITPNFFGLLGGNGALPMHYTERIAERETYRRDRAARGFLDIFNNRLTAQFYGAWKKYQLPMQCENDPSKNFLPLLLSLVGINDTSMQHRLQGAEGGVYDESLAYYAAAVRQRPMSAQMLERVLADYFCVPIAIEQFVGHWYSIPKEQHSILGGMNVVLDSTAFVGEKVWQRHLRMRLWIGPMKRRDFEKFLPKGDAAIALREWVNVMLGPVYEYEIRLTLRKEEMMPVRLGKDEHGCRLGWDTWLQTHKASEDRNDVGYEICAV